MKKLFVMASLLAATASSAQSNFMQDRALANEWSDIGRRQCLVDGFHTKICDCIGGGMLGTPVADIKAALELIDKGLPTSKTRAMKHVEQVSTTCLKFPPQ